MFTNGENLMAKTPPGNFQVTTPEIPLLSQQVVTSKRISVPYTNLKLNSYPNTQLDLFCSDNFSFRCMAPKYVTNQLCGSQYATSITNLRRLLVAKFFSSSQRWRSRQCLVTQPYGAHTEQLLQEGWTKANFVSGHNLLAQTLLNTCTTCELFNDP